MGLYSKHEEHAMPETKAERIAYKTIFDEFCMVVDNPKIRFSKITTTMLKSMPIILNPKGLRLIPITGK